MFCSITQPAPHGLYAAAAYPAPSPLEHLSRTLERSFQTPIMYLPTGSASRQRLMRCTGRSSAVLLPARVQQAILQCLMREADRWLVLIIWEGPLRQAG